MDKMPAMPKLIGLIINNVKAMVIIKNMDFPSETANMKNQLTSLKFIVAID